MKYTIKKRIKNSLTYLYTAWYALGHPIEKKILFSSFGGKQYSDNPRAISEKMHELYPDYKLVWILKNLSDSYSVIPDYVQCIKRDRFNFYRELATAACFVTNEDINAGIYKRKKQFFVQTWHGDIGIKKVLYDIFPKEEYPERILDGRVTDLCVAGSDLAESVYRTAFDYHGEVLKIGTPRNDKLVQINEEEVAQVKSKLGLESEVKILLYAPTFRDNNADVQCVNVNLQRVLSVLEQTSNQSWVCLTRAHSASNGLVLEDEGNRAIDVTDYPDMADLLCISDMLITDYSSSAGDFIIRNKPVILVHFDKDEYEKKCRAFKFSCSEAGFIIAYNQEQLEQIISECTDEVYAENCAKLKRYFNKVETGKAAEEICRRIDEQYLKYEGK